MKWWKWFKKEPNESNPWEEGEKIKVTLRDVVEEDARIFQGKLYFPWNKKRGFKIK